MPVTTSRLGLGAPASGDNISSYPALAQATNAILDNATTYTSGTFAARPAAGTAGRVYRATDVTTPGTPNGAVYFDNGTSWYQVGTDVEPAFSAYKTFRRAGGSTTVAPTAGTYVMPLAETGFIANDSALIVPPTIASASFYLDPADWAAGTRTVKFRVRAYVITNATAPATTWTVGLYPISTWGGAAGSEPTIASLGTVITGSTVPFATPASGGPTAVANSGDFNAPAAGHYAVAVVNSGAAAANSWVIVKAEMQYRQV